MKTLKSVNSIRLNINEDQLWRFLTLPEWTEKYMFNCRVTSDFNIGSSIEWKGEFQGVKAHLSGEVLECVPKTKLKYTLIDPAFSDPSDPDNFVHVTYDIKSQNHEILLTIVNETFDGKEERMQEITQGWEGLVFPIMRSIVESGVDI